MLRGDQRSYNLCESQGRKRKVIGAGWEPGVPWEELHLSWALPVPQFPFTLLLSGQHAGVDVAAPRSLQVQGGGNISGRKNSQENVFLCFLLHWKFAQWLCPHVPHGQLGSGVLG